MKNPIEVIREEHGYSRTEFGVLCGVISETIRQVERGTIRNIAPGIKKALERLGYDTEQVARDMEAWREQYKEDLFKKVSK